MLFLCVFNLIMADALERLHEHHHGGYTRARNFGRVVQRARKATGAKRPRFPETACSQRSNRSGWNGTGSMLQIRDHSTVQPSSAAKRSLASLASRSSGQARRHRGRADLASLRSGRRPPSRCQERSLDCRWCRQHRHASWRWCRISRASLAAAASASRRVFIGRGAGVRLLTVERDGMCRSTPLVPSTTPAEAQAFKHGTLFDVEFEICGGVRCSLWASGNRVNRPRRSGAPRLPGGSRLYPYGRDPPRSNGCRRRPTSQAGSGRIARPLHRPNPPDESSTEAAVVLGVKRRSTSSAASTSREPSSQPPLGTESR